jgi:C-terminal processing protease CtpA/Prc
MALNAYHAPRIQRKGRSTCWAGHSECGETFGMALLGREPLRLIGLNTQGVFSDILSRSLPNGWRFHLPNELYLTSDGRTFDGTGVPLTFAYPSSLTQIYEMAGRQR